MDMVFNYGTFDDSDPNFYLNFTKGLMVYALSAYPFVEFVEEYQVQQRGVIEQTLQLTCEAKQRLFAALRNNVQPQNRFYNYYFHTDNCTTRARDMVADSSGVAITFSPILPPETPTYRNLIHEYLNKAGQYWSKFGIDLCLGSNLDKKVTNEQAMFLPDYLLKGFDSASIHHQPLVAAKQTVLPMPAQPQNKGTSLTPFIAFTLLLALVLVAMMIKARWTTTALFLFDSLFFLLTGLLGVVITTLWIIRIDDVCRNNFNVLWALPTHVIIAFVLRNKKAWVRQYFRITLIISILLAVAWFLLPQQLNTAVWPLLAIILLRSYVRAKQK
jgi:hypothetical protein